MEQLIHITATYSNALLVAILPHVSDFAKKLDLPIAQPITQEQVLRFNPNPYKGHFSGTVILKNHWWFHFDEGGYVDSFSSATNWFTADEDAVDNTQYYTGTTRMTTNEIIGFARTVLLKLGYPPALTHSDAIPELQGPYNLKQGGHVTYSRVLWEPVTDHDSGDYSKVRVEVNTQERALVGLYIWFTKTNRTRIAAPLKIDVEPELETDFRKRTKVGGMFIRSNAPPGLPKK